MSTTPASADRSIEAGIRRPRKTRVARRRASSVAAARRRPWAGLDEAASGGSGRARAARGRVHRIAGDQRERDRVEHEREHELAGREQQAGDRRARRSRRGCRASPRREFAGPNSRSSRTRLGMQGADRRVEERREAGGEDGDRADRPQRPVGRDDPGQHEHARGRARGPRSRRTSRRSKRSVMIPAGIDSRMYGSIRAAPTMPEDDRVLRLLVDEHDEGDEVQPVADRATRTRR